MAKWQRIALAIALVAGVVTGVGPTLDAAVADPPPAHTTPYFEDAPEGTTAVDLGCSGDGSCWVVAIDENEKPFVHPVVGDSIGAGVPIPGTQTGNGQWFFENQGQNLECGPTDLCAYVMYGPTGTYVGVLEGGVPSSPETLRDGLAGSLQPSGIGCGGTTCFVTGQLPNGQNAIVPVTPDGRGDVIVLEGIGAVGAISCFVDDDCVVFTGVVENDEAMGRLTTFVDGALGSSVELGRGGVWQLECSAFDRCVGISQDTLDGINDFPVNSSIVTLDGTTVTKELALEQYRNPDGSRATTTLWNLDCVDGIEHCLASGARLVYDAGYTNVQHDALTMVIDDGVVGVDRRFPQPVYEGYAPAGLQTVACTAADCIGMGFVFTPGFGVSWVLAYGLERSGEAIYADTLKPTATITSPSIDYRVEVDGPATASYECDDRGISGLASCIGMVGTTPVPDGGALPTGTPGTFELKVTATDGNGNTDVATRQYVVFEQLPPVIDALERDVPAGVSSVFLPSATDPNGDDFSFSVDGQPAHGSAVMTSALILGAVQYTPEPGYTGPDSVTVRATDSTGRSSTRTVDLLVRDDGVSRFEGPLSEGQFVGTGLGTPTEAEPLLVAMTSLGRASLEGTARRVSGNGPNGRPLIGGSMEIASSAPTSGPVTDTSTLMYFSIAFSELAPTDDAGWVNAAHDGVPCVDLSSGVGTCRVNSFRYGDFVFVAVQTDDPDGTWTFFPTDERRAPDVNVYGFDDGTVLYQGEQQALGYDCSDGGGSGLASCHGSVGDTSVASGTPVPSDVPGVYLARVVASDGVGNVRTVERTYTVLPSSAGADVELPAATRPGFFRSTDMDCTSPSSCLVGAVERDDSVGPLIDRGMLIPVEDGVAQESAVVTLPAPSGLVRMPWAIDCVDDHTCWVAGMTMTDNFDFGVGTGAFVVRVVDGVVGEVHPIGRVHTEGPGETYDFFGPTALECSSADACVLGGWQPSNGAALVRIGPDGPAAVQELEQRLDTPGYVTALSCPGGGTCLVAPNFHNLDDQVVEVDAAGSTPRARLSPLQGKTVVAIECQTIERCRAAVGPAPGNTSVDVLPTIATIDGDDVSTQEVEGLGDRTSLTGLTCPTSIDGCLAYGYSFRPGRNDPAGFVVPVQDGDPGAPIGTPGSAQVHALGCTPTSCDAYGFTHGFGGSNRYGLEIFDGLRRHRDVPVPQADAVAPDAVIGSPVAGARLAVDQVVSAAYTCEDDPGGSGIASCSGTVEPGGVAIASGDPVPTSSAGSFTLEVVATDNVGNTFERSVSYEVAVASIAAPVPTGGGTVTTDPTGHGATPAEPVQTAVEVPAGVAATEPMVVIPGPAPEPAATQQGFTLVGQRVAITAPPASAEAPYRVTFTIDGADLGGADPEDIAVFRDGLPVEPCDPSEPVAAVPEPCREPAVRAEAPSDDVLVSVRTAHFTDWTFGLRTAATANDDLAYETYRGTTLTVPGPGVLANDVLVTSEGAPAPVVTVDTSGLQGIVLMGAGGGFSYLPPANFSGTDTFTYTVAQGSGPEHVSNTATVKVLVKPQKPTTITAEPFIIKMVLGLVPFYTLRLDATVKATDGTPVVGRPVVFSRKGLELCTATTDLTGRARCSLLASKTNGLIAALQSLKVDATYAGDEVYLGSSTIAPWYG